MRNPIVTPTFPATVSKLIYVPPTLVALNSSATAFGAGSASDGGLQIS